MMSDIEEEEREFERSSSYTPSSSGSSSGGTGCGCLSDLLTITILGILIWLIQQIID